MPRCEGFCIGKQVFRLYSLGGRIFHPFIQQLMEKFWVVLIPSLAASLEIAGVFPTDSSEIKMPTMASKAGCSWEVTFNFYADFLSPAESQAHWRALLFCYVSRLQQVLNQWEEFHLWNPILYAIHQIFYVGGNLNSVTRYVHIALAETDSGSSVTIRLSFIEFIFEVWLLVVITIVGS